MTACTVARWPSGHARLLGTVDAPLFMSAFPEGADPRGAPLSVPAHQLRASALGKVPRPPTCWLALAPAPTLLLSECWVGLTLSPEQCAPSSPRTCTRPGAPGPPPAPGGTAQQHARCHEAAALRCPALTLGRLSSGVVWKSRQGLTFFSNADRTAQGTRWVLPSPCSSLLLLRSRHIAGQLWAQRAPGHPRRYRRCLPRSSGCFVAALQTRASRAVCRLWHPLFIQAAWRHNPHHVVLVHPGLSGPKRNWIHAGGRLFWPIPASGS